MLPLIRAAEGEPQVIAASLCVAGAALSWLALMLRRKRRDAPGPGVILRRAAQVQMVGAVLLLAGLFAVAQGLAAMPVVLAVVPVGAGALVATLVGRQILGDAPGLWEWPVAIGVLIAAAWTGPLDAVLMLLIAGGSAGAQGLLLRRGDPLDLLATHMLLAAPLAAILLVGDAPLRGLPLVLTLLAALALTFGLWGWLRTGRAAGSVALLLAAGAGLAMEGWPAIG
ncbi:hypothetical protein [Falsirhodobacter halotolerans]|uniref:hypothetical protein n=1 Tax=Falsirhodobacter halotolerans TaxID=1146892 RepID=UPI001FD4A98B|nr:hypothetical protein [Falsirhodobacter halotolerans]MCJ8138740.1 hypothetical protein [Falsirhodobacter halotolerans]